MRYAIFCLIIVYLVMPSAVAKEPDASSEHYPAWGALRALLRIYNLNGGGYRSMMLRRYMYEEEGRPFKVSAKFVRQYNPVRAAVRASREKFETELYKKIELDELLLIKGARCKLTFHVGISPGINIFNDWFSTFGGATLRSDVTVVVRGVVKTEDGDAIKIAIISWKSWVTDTYDFDNQREAPEVLFFYLSDGALFQMQEAGYTTPFPVSSSKWEVKNALNRTPVFFYVPTGDGGNESPE